MGNNVFIGKKQGHLTVIKKCGRIGGHQTFECVCDCGKTVKLRESHLYESRLFCKASCPLRVTKTVGANIGLAFGRWTVIKDAGRQFVGGRNRIFAKCRCICGTEREVSMQMLVDGSSLSCGCALLEKITVHLTPESKREARRTAARKCARSNPARMKANKIAYENRLARATPVWLTKEHWEQMNAFYMEARRLTAETGTRHEVDHIVPLNGKLVNGLHVPWNLQVLTQTENVSKSNRYAELHGDMEK